MFQNRREAGRRLADALAALGLPDALVLGIPRGGVIVAEAVASRLGATLDVVVPHKLGAPGNPELAVGAVTVDGTCVLDPRLVDVLGISEDYLRRETERQHREIERRLLAFRGVGAEADPAGRTVIVVDDGIATGATAEVAVISLRRRGAPRIVLAVPVAAREALERIAPKVDDVVCLSTPEPFFAVGQWYVDFEQTTDEQVVEALRGSTSSAGSTR